MNAIIIIIDALRFSNVGCYGYTKDTTPNIDKLATRSIVFENCFAQANYTDISLTTILSGKHPLEHGVLFHGFSFTKENMNGLNRSRTVFLQEILQQSGFRTIAIDWLGRWHKRGFDYYYGIQEKQNTRVKESAKALAVKLITRYSILRKMYSKVKGSSDARDNCEKVTREAIKQMDQVGKNSFFTFMHYWDVHPPYAPPKEHSEKFVHDEEDIPLREVFQRGVKEQAGGEYDAFKSGRHLTLNDAKRDYDGAVHWVDSQIGRLVDHLTAKGLMEKTMIVITADHGHNFGEHSIYFDNASLYDTSIKVPMIIWHPELRAQRIAGMVQHTDIMPTILDFAGKEIPSGLDGNVLPVNTRDDVIAEAFGSRFRMIRTQNYKYIEPVEILNNVPENVKTWYRGNGKQELYDLCEDPDELNNVAEDYPEVVKELKQKLDNKLLQYGSKRKLGSKLKKLKKK